MMGREEYNISHTVLSVSIKNKKKQHLISKAGKNRNILIKEDYAFEVFSYKISNNWLMIDNEFFWLKIAIYSFFSSF